MIGLGIDPISINTPVFTAATANIQAAGGTNQTVGAGLFNNILSTFNQVSATVQKVLPAVQQAKTAADQLKDRLAALKQGTQSVNVNASAPGISNTQLATSWSTGEKIAAGVGTVALIGAIIYAVKSKKKK